MTESRQRDDSWEEHDEQQEAFHPSLSPPVPCPYLPGRLSRCEAYLADGIDSGLYERLMSYGFRRSGGVIYRPQCDNCQACLPLRVDVNSFAPSRSLRRVARRNQDVVVQHGKPAPTEEKFRLFCRYLDFQHDSTMARSFDAFLDFLYDSPVTTLEFTYVLDGQMVGASIADECPGGLSSVYMYFEPQEHCRSLGTYSVLREIEHCRLAGWPYYYLGYWVAGSRTMDYKSRFKPHEVLVADDHWVSVESDC